MRRSNVSNLHTANALLGGPPRIFSIREYSRIGDGIHHMQHMPLPAIMERLWPGSQALLRRITVLGSHVLRYSSNRETNSFLRRYQRTLPPQLTHIEQPITYEYINNYDQVDSDHENDPEVVNRIISRRIRHRQYHFGRHPKSKEPSWLKLANWKIYFGMLCFFAVQGILKYIIEDLYDIK